MLCDMPSLDLCNLRREVMHRMGKVRGQNRYERGLSAVAAYIFEPSIGQKCLRGLGQWRQHGRDRVLDINPIERVRWRVCCRPEPGKRVMSLAPVRQERLEYQHRQMLTDNTSSQTSYQQW